MSIFAICPLTVLPIRMGSTHRSEMGSQLLFGETVEIMDTKGLKWSKIRCLHDDFIGWIPTMQLKLISAEQLIAYRASFAYSLDVFHPIMGAEEGMMVTLGAHLPDFDGIRLELPDLDFTFSGQAVFPEDIRPGPAMMIKIARKLLNAPYLWGGRTATGIDSAALVQLVCQICSVQLPRRAEGQVNRGEIVDFVAQALPGDIAFFENNHGRITHSGILLQDEKIIHVHDKVRIDNLDHYGIFNNDLKKYTHRLRVVKRIFPKLSKGLPRKKEQQEEVATQQVLFS